MNKQLIHDLNISNQKATFRYENGLPLRLYFVTDSIIRLVIDPSEEFSYVPTIMKQIEVPDEGDATVATGGAGKQVLKEQILLPEIEQKIHEATITDSGLSSGKYQVTIDTILARLQIFDENQNCVLQMEGQPLVKDPEKHLGITLRSDPQEYFYGGGTQNGIVNLKGRKIEIENQNSWTEGGVASPVPFFFSTKGYGILVNTFTRGAYSFHTPRATTIRHEDHKLDLFIILGSQPETIIHGYHQLTGKPAMSPLYSYYPAHLNAYNRDYWVQVTPESDGAILFPDGKYYKEYQPIHPKTFNTGYRVGTIDYQGMKLVPNVSLTKHVEFLDVDEVGNPQVAIRESLNGENDNAMFSARAVIDRYEEYDLPLGWFLPNDGYGAGYGQTDSLRGDLQNLQEFGEYARDKGVELGLWTQETLTPKDPNHPQKDERDLSREVSEAGVAALKTDVAWVGEGYTFGLNGVADAYQKMLTWSKKRPFIVTLDGWAGTQRYAAIWSGDQEGGDWQNVKFHIPTYLSTGLSGNPHVGADIDGIFGGRDPIIQTRDLQWKTFTPIQLTMDGWGSNPKDLGIHFGNEYLDINRFYLKLKTMLLPYFYSLAHEARESGKPILRPLFFEEASEFTYGSSCEKQFLLGPSLLVAPIFEPYQLAEDGSDKRAHLYLPDAEQHWHDFFTGKSYHGGQSIAEFPAPLWKLPLFIKSGSILPFTDATNHPNEIRYETRKFAIYPSHEKTRFSLYEDDGISMGYEKNEYITTEISQVMDTNINITIAGAEGNYPAVLKERETIIYVFSERLPEEVIVDEKLHKNWSYEKLLLPTFAPADSDSRFANQQISPGKFIRIHVETQPITNNLNIEIVF